MFILQSFRKLVPLQLAIPLAVGGLTSTMATHAAVLTRRLSPTAVNGGRVTDPVKGRRIAATSISILLPVAFLVTRGAGAAGVASRTERGLLGALAAAALASVPAQTLGTTFERRYMAPTALALAIGLGRLAIER